MLLQVSIIPTIKIQDALATLALVLPPRMLDFANCYVCWFDSARLIIDLVLAILLTNGRHELIIRCFREVLRLHVELAGACTITVVALHGRIAPRLRQQFLLTILRDISRAVMLSF